MSQNKQTRRELIELEVRVNELERAQAYLNREYYAKRKEQLLERKEDIQIKLDNKELAPDVQFILSEQYEETDNKNLDKVRGPSFEEEI